MSPTTRHSLLSSTLSLATMLPVTRPAISTFWVSMSASTTPEPSSARRGSSLTEMRPLTVP